ncbi:Fc receptor-like protein 5 [Scyliorhinus canicula]|uniref:Fc receptor-like protein 5 n=1 Tax=Scyliorhinus canicula TaxID=7830 RepID=UPI0018F47C61|nr:Fc receptor-like protein 5 [Scyliorhinus canicula]
MWILIPLICSLPVSGALSAEKKVTGIVGRAITINCHYDGAYREMVKYWCDGVNIRCSILVKSDDSGGRRGRMSIRDNKAERMFVVTVEDLRSEDTGWYSCGIKKPGLDILFAVELQISEESVSVPVLRFLSPPKVSCSGGSVSVSCESLRGSLPIQYTWTEKTPSGDLKISDTNELDLRCRSFKQQQHRYYCTASNTQGKQSSQMVNVSVISLSEQNCSYVAKISSNVSGALSAEKKVTGIVGRAITINCHYDGAYREKVKYWCDGVNIRCSILVKSDDSGGRRGRMSIRDNKAERMFVVTVEDLRSEDTGWYSCGIKKPGLDILFGVELQISEESVSVPVLRFLSPPKVSCSGGSVSVSCESLRGSLPIQYTWTEKTPSGDSSISDTNKLDLRCQSFKQQQHQYYCTASNNQGEQSSQMVNVSVISLSEQNCSYVAKISSNGTGYYCESPSTVSPATTHAPSTSTPSLIYIVLGVLGAILIVFAVFLLLYLKKNNKDSNGVKFHRKDKTMNNNQQLVAAEESTAGSSLPGTQSKGNDQIENDKNGIAYAVLQFQKVSPAQSGEVERHSVINRDRVTYSGINFHNQPPEHNRKTSSLNTPQDSEMAVYANVTR